MRQLANGDGAAHRDDVNELRAEILQIDSALARLAEARYGICDSCKRQIPANRLEALPYATRCLKCEPQLGLS